MPISDEEPPMPLFSADPERCRRDGACVAECPVRIVELPEGAPAPVVRPELEEFCRNCGHCVAVCPTEAVRLATMPPEHLPRVRPDWPLGVPELTQVVRARRSTRTYTSRRVPRATLSALIEVASFAPTASNRQPVRWVVLDDPAEVRRLGGLVAEWMRAGLPKQPPAARRNV
jgi:ferredoxin